VNTKLPWSNGGLNSATNFYKTKEEQQIFLDFRFLKQERKENANKAKYFWIFQIASRK
jgi:hypothetical protein